MAKDVNLLSYWMPLLRGIKEFKEIAKAEEPELRYILAAIDRTLNNFFIDTADEYGISRFESMMGIYPDPTDTLDTRRFRVKSEWNDYVPYTEPELYRRLVSICGSPDLFDIEEHYNDYWIKVITQVGIKGAFDMVSSTLDDMLPCNLVLQLENVLKAIKTSELYLGGVCCTAFGYCITNDIEAEDKLSGYHVIAIGSGKAGTHIITNDIAAKVSKSSELSNAVAMATGNLSGDITHDISVRDALSSPHYEGIGAGMAFTKIITHDINSTVNSNGNTLGAMPVNVASVITIT